MTWIIFPINFRDIGYDSILSSTVNYVNFSMLPSYIKIKILAKLD